MIGRQCSLRLYFVHTLGAQVAQIVHPAVCVCVLPYIKVGHPGDS